MARGPLGFGLTLNGLEARVQWDRPERPGLPKKKAGAATTPVA